MDLKGIISLLWVLVCIILILLLAWFASRKIASGYMTGTLGGSYGKLKLTARLPLGKSQSLVVVKAGESNLLLGVTESSINLICKLSPEEAEAFNTDVIEEASGRDFHKLFDNLLKKDPKNGD